MNEVQQLINSVRKEYYGYEVFDSIVSNVGDELYLTLILDPNDPYEIGSNDSSLHTVKEAIFYEHDVYELGEDELVKQSQIIADQINNEMNFKHLDHVEDNIVEIVEDTHPGVIVDIDWAWKFSLATGKWVCEQAGHFSSGL